MLFSRHVAVSRLCAVTPRPGVYFALHGIETWSPAGVAIVPFAAVALRYAGRHQLPVTLETFVVHIPHWSSSYI